MDIKKKGVGYKLADSPPPVLYVCWKTINSARLRKGISIRGLCVILREKYNILTARHRINDMLLMRQPECRAALFFAVCEILNLRFEDCVLRREKKDTQAELVTDIFNKRLKKESICTFKSAKIKFNTKKSDNLVKFNSGSVGRSVKEGIF
jgi:hypothetical protein